jgi:hypothetical protein
VPERCIPLMTTVRGLTCAVNLEALRENFGINQRNYTSSILAAWLRAVTRCFPGRVSVAAKGALWMKAVDSKKIEAAS